MGRPTSRHSPLSNVTLKLLFACSLALHAAACSAKKPVETTYFDRTISPILQDSCVSTNTGANCHTSQERGNALGNLSLESYDDLIKRSDLLINYGPYNLPNLLLKNTDPFDIVYTAYDGTTLNVRTDIRHSGGKTVGLTSAGYHTLKAWIAGGANKSNADTPPLLPTRDDCSEIFPLDANFIADTDPATPDYPSFKATVQPILGDTCAAGNCHGSATNSLRLVCATSKGGQSNDVLARWNYYAASQYLASKAENLGASELLRRPLDPHGGGVYHEGGAIFPTQSDPSYIALSKWATDHGPSALMPMSKGFDFFAKRVQPMLMKKGCMIVGCHSPAMFHDYRLHGGSGASFSLPTTLTNYKLTLAQIALESADLNASRLVAKNLTRPDLQAGGRGILHRGGALLDDFGTALASPTLCDLKDGGAAEVGPLDDQHAYCVIARWVQIEQAAAALAPLSGVVYVKRPPAAEPDLPQDFGNYAAGSDLCFTALTQDVATGALKVGDGVCQSLLAACAGLSPATADIRHPTVSWKGDQIAFAARNDATEPLAIWRMNVDGSACAKDDAINALPAVPGWIDNGAPIHNFDPVFTPDDRIVFASTRGNVMNTDAFEYHGPTRTPADPTRWNANLYILDASGKIRQLTFLLNQELSPSMMSDGRLIFSTEKRAPNFYQLAGRRMNLDGGDYHPLYAQRKSIGYNQMTEVVELADKNFAAIFSDPKSAHGAGTLGIFNRSLGPDQVSQDKADYPADPNAVGWPAPDFYLHSLHLPDAAATGHTGPGNTGAYRSPAPLPNGNILVSYAANAMDLASFSGNFDLFIMDEITGTKTPLTTDAGTDELFPVAVYGRMNRGVFQSRTDEANANTRVYADGEDPAHPANVSDITVLNANVLGGLLFQNTRTGIANPVTQRVLPNLGFFEVYEDMPPGANDAPSFTSTDAYGPVYARRRLLGSVPLMDDGSARMVVPGGLPLVLRGVFALDGMGPSQHFQREEMQFYPGEYTHQSFRPSFFNGLCAGCHGSVSGEEIDIAVQPDILTQASRVESRQGPAATFTGPPGARLPEVGPME